MEGPIEIFVAKTQLLPFGLPTEAIALLGRSHSPHHVQAYPWDGAMVQPRVGIAVMCPS
jgi:hypothetical protein